MKFLPSRPGIAHPGLRRALAAGLFLLAWALLNVVFNLRHPSRQYEPALWYLLPSIDVCALLGIFALVGSFGRRIPAWICVALTPVVVFVRLFRIADGLVQQNYYRPVNLYLDLPLLPDLARLLRSTVPPPRLLLGAVIAVAILAAFALLVHRTLILGAGFLAAGRGQRGLFAGVVAVLAAASPLWPAGGDTGPLHHGLFGASVAPAAVEQMRFATAAGALRRAKAAEIRATEERLQRTPSDLRALRGADVLLFLVESYGSTVFRNPQLRGEVGPALEALGAALAGRGFFVASSFVASSTYGGGSWLAHATLATGVRIGDGLEYAVVRQIEPPPATMAGVFKRAGYRTVLVQPGTTRPWPEGVVAGFDRKYYAADMEYEGAAFGWATMPDEYVVHFIHGRELALPGRPLFVEYALISSHAPWAVTPLPLHDWSRFDRGRAFDGTRARHFPVTWGKFENAGAAYAHALRYDLEILGRYITERVARDSFIVILGDHQPAGAITGGDPSHAVPIHVISRDRRLVDRFEAAGYAAGMTPPAAGPVAGLETLLPALVERFSDGPPVTSQSKPVANPVR